jgi:RNA-binding protein
MPGRVRFLYFDMETISPAFNRQLKSRAQLLEPILKLGQAGVTPAFITSLNEALIRHSLVKIRFGAFKEEKKRLAVEIAGEVGAQLVCRVGNTAVYYRAPEPIAPK